MPTTQAPEDDVRVIACDESGSESETLIASQHPVFVHASVNLPLDSATELRDGLRAATRTQAPEMKSKIILRPRHRAVLLELIDNLADTVNISLVDKSYFLTSKLIETIIGPHAEQWDTNIGTSGQGREWAEYLDRHAPDAVGAVRWDAVLSTYNSLVRSHQRAGSIAPGVEPFFFALEDAFNNCTDDGAREILWMLWESRWFALEFEGKGEVELRELDPLFPTMSAAARNWAMRMGDAPFEFLADTYSLLTPSVCSLIVDASRQTLWIADRPQPIANLRRITTADSRSDARIQLADLLAGVGREVARLAMTGVLDDDLQIAVHEMLDINVMASSGSPLDILVDRRELRYRDVWVAKHWA